MDTLRLIKPWHLQPIQQRLGDERNALPIPCCGPVSDHYEIHLSANDVHCDNLRKHNNAPVSDVIFASTSKIER